MVRINCNNPLINVLTGCLFIFAIFFSLSYQFPMMADNYLFSKSITPNFASVMSGASIEKLEPMTLKAAFTQSIEMYSTWCGRFLGNFLVYCCFLLPHLARCILSSALFVFLCFLIHVSVRGVAWRVSLNAQSLLFIAGFLWLAMPSFGSAFFWVSVGGIPAIIAQIVFLLPYRWQFDRPFEKNSILYCLAFFICGLCTASLDYPSCASMPVTAGLATLYFYFRQEKPRNFSIFNICGFLGVSLGAAITFFAKGNAQRMLLTRDTAVHEWAVESFGIKVTDYILNLSSSFVLHCIPLLLLLFSLYFIRSQYKTDWYKYVPKISLFYLVPFLATHGSYFFIPWPPARAFNTTAVQLMISSLGCVYFILENIEKEKTLIKYKTYFKYFCYFIIIYCVLSIFYEEYKFHKVIQITNNRNAIFIENRGKDVLICPLGVQGDHYMILGSDLQDISYDKDNWINRAVSAYWGVKSISLKNENENKNFLITLKTKNHEDCTIKCKRENLSLHVNVEIKSKKAPEFRYLYFYYYGKLSLISYLPRVMSDAIVSFLHIHIGFIDKFIPIIFAQSSLSLKWERSLDGIYSAKGTCELWGVFNDFDYLWVVQPGNDKFSFNLLRLNNVYK